MDRPKILVIDDEKHIRLLYKEELEDDGYAVATSDGEEPILELLEREAPQAVILDIRLGPDRCGLDLLQLIRNRGRPALDEVQDNSDDLELRVQPLLRFLDGGEKILEPGEGERRGFRRNEH